MKLGSKYMLGAIYMIIGMPYTRSTGSDGGSNDIRYDTYVPEALTIKKANTGDFVENPIALTELHEREIVARHNLLRTIAQPPARMMRKMSWDDELATVATDYTRKCIYEHNPDRKHSRFQYIGENLYISMGIPFNTALMTNAISAWDNEKEDYDYETRKCVPGRMCGHYTQVVWDDSFKVGCGVTICSEIMVRGKLWNHATLFACNYGPGGNYDRHPFLTGTPCTFCHEKDRCSDNLCTNKMRDRSDIDITAVAKWGKWSAWSACSTTCIGGSARRERFCNTFVPNDCEGPSREITFTCAPNLCNRHPLLPGGGSGESKWLPWTAWSECSKTCGNGIVSRRRKCQSGRSCSGINLLTSSCNKGDCTVPSGWTKWGEWEECSTTCGEGIQKRKRACVDPNRCSGNREIRKICNVQQCIISIPKWSKWSKFGPCSASCGGGSRRKTRSCLTGNDCQGPSAETESCNLDRCPGKLSQWSSWQPCSVSCGIGFSIKTRSCIGGGRCKGSLTKRESCNEGACPVFGPWTMWGDCDVTCGSGNTIRTRVCSTGNDDCDGRDTEALPCAKQECTTTGWSAWNLWDPCSRTCGGGTKSRNRICNVGDTGPSICPGPETDTAECKTQKCPEFTEWTTWTSCDRTCGEGGKTRSRTCGSHNGRGCFGRRTEAESCKIMDCTKSHWSSWGTWSSCSRTCSEGTRKRTRKCNVGNTGLPCSGENTEVKGCHMRSCPILPKEKDPPNKESEEKDPPNKSPEERENNTSDKTRTKDEKTGTGGGNSIRHVPSLYLLLFIALFNLYQFQ